MVGCGARLVCIQRSTFTQAAGCVHLNALLLGQQRLPPAGALQRCQPVQIAIATTITTTVDGPDIAVQSPSTSMSQSPVVPHNACVIAAGGVVVVSHTLDLLQSHQQPLQQCASLFSHIQCYLQGECP